MFLECSDLETNLASRWGGSQAPPSFWEVPGLPRKFPGLPRKFFGDFPESPLTVELNSNPEAPRKFPKPPRKFPKLPRRFPDFPGGQPLSLGSLTPSPDSQKLSLILECSGTFGDFFETLSAFRARRARETSERGGLAPQTSSRLGVPSGQTKSSMTVHKCLEAQQRYFSYRAILVAIVSQNLSCLFFMGYRTIIARYVAKWGSHRCACVKLSAKGGYRTSLGAF